MKKLSKQTVIKRGIKPGTNRTRTVPAVIVEPYY